MMQRPDADLALENADALHLAVLGPPVVRWGAREVTFRSRKELTLLVYLAVTRTAQPREHLAGLFWPEHDEARARNSLRTTLSRLREHLAAAGGVPVAALPVLQTERTALGGEVVALAGAGAPAPRLDVEPLAADPSAAMGEAALVAAAAAYRGPFLAGLHIKDAPELEAWLEAQRAYWQRQVERVLGHLTGLQLGRRALAEAGATAQRWLALNALSEPACRALMRALAGAGDRAGALAVYEQCRHALREQLGADPAPETAALAERLRRLPLSTAAPLPAGAPSDGGPVAPPVDLPFVGRGRELAVLVATYQAARAGQLQLVVLEGEAGSGKTRLVEEFLRWATLEGADVLRSRGDEARGAVPYQLLVDALRPRLAREHAPEDLVADVWLAELVRLFPELHERYPDLPAPATLGGDEAGGSVRLFEAVHQLILALAERARPGALVLCYDDVQWSDLAMRDLLLFRLRRQAEAGAPQLLVLTVQSEALARDLELEQWLSRLARQVPTLRLSLGPLAEEEVTQALAALVGEPITAGRDDALQIVPWLYAESEGRPFYLVELLRALADRGILVPHDQGSDGAAGAAQAPRLALAPGVERLPHLVPASVHGLVRDQLRGLSEPAFEVLAAAAVLGSDATFERLFLVAELEERTGLVALDDLRRRGLLVETTGEPVPERGETGGTVAWRFAHGLVREVVYTEAGETRRRLFHRRAYALLEGSAAPAVLARHAQAAGLTEPALHALVAAGDAALAVSAGRDASTHYEQARRLLAGPDGTDQPPQRDWGEAPAIPVLQGRVEELAVLAGWVREGRCRVVQVLGAGGTGKTTLVARLAQDLAPEFKAIYWRSLRNAPPAEEWLAGAISALAVSQVAAPVGLEAQLRLLLGLLRARRALLVLDNLETVLEPGTAALRYRVGYEGYGEALRQLAESAHRSCVLLTSREQPLRADEPAVRALHLVGLRVEDGRALLGRWSLAGDDAAWAALVARYAGNPLALQVVGETIQSVFGEDIAAFLAQETSVFGSIRQLLDEQVARLSPLERAVLTWLAVEREPVGFGELVADLGPGVERGAVVEAVQALQRRALLEWVPGSTFTLQPVVLEYATAQLVEGLEREVLAGEPTLLESHALVKATARDYVRRSQERLIAQPLLERLRARDGGEAEERRLLGLLGAWRGRPPEEQAYGPGNVVNLLCLLRGELRGLDLSRLAIRQAYLAEVEAQDASLAGAQIAGGVLAEAFHIPARVALSADGAYLVAGTTTGEVRLWRVADRTPLLAVPGHSGIVLGLALSGDGRRLASCGQDGRIRLWEVLSGRPLAALEGHTGGVLCVALSGDGRLLASGSEDGMVQLWEVPSGRPLATLQGHTAAVRAVALSGDGRLLASGSFDGTVRLGDAESGHPLARLEGHAGVVWGVALSGDGELLASAGSDGTVRLWEAASGRPLARLRGYSGAVYSLALSGDGQLLASAGADGTVRLWEAPSGRPLAMLRGHTGAVWGLALSGDGRLLASVRSDGALRLREAQSGRLLATLRGHTGAVWGLALSGDGRLLASGGNGTVRLWEVPSGRPLATLEGHTAGVFGVALSGDGRLLASGGADGTLRLWEAGDGRPLATLRGHGGVVWGVALSRDGQLLASAGADGTVRLWEAPSGCPLATLRGHTGAVEGVALSGDGRLLASGGDGTVRLWEVPSGRPLATLRGHTGAVRGVALSGDGGLLASGSEDGTVRLWEAQSGRPLATLLGHSGMVRVVALSEDGRLLASGGSDGTVRLWDVSSGACLQVLRAERRYERMDITGLRGVTEAQRAALLALGAVERDP